MFIRAVEGRVKVWRMKQGEDIKAPVTNEERYHVAAMVVRYRANMEMKYPVTEY